jgi:hypothetical protein
MNYFSTVISLVSERQNFLEEIHHGIKIQSKISALMISSFCSFALYGAIIGASHSPQQMLSSAIKVPALYLISLLVCLPTLYVFNVFFGAKESFGQHLAFLLTPVSIIALLLCGFAPISLFFLLSVKDYRFFLLLNVAIFALTGIMGVSFLYKIMKPIAKNDTAQGVKARTSILRLWLGLYGLVGTQLGWTLKPFFGTPDGKFELFRSEGGSFFSAVWNSLMNLLF